MDREVSLQSESDQVQADSPAPTNSYSGDAAADDDLEERIRLKAYEIYCSRNGSEGSAVEDWLTAEREVRFGGSAAERSGHASSLIESVSEDAQEDAQHDVAG